MAGRFCHTLTDQDQLMTMRVSKEMCNAIGVLHGGALMSFCAPCHSLGGDFVVSSINFMEKFDGLGLGNCCHIIACLVLLHGSQSCIPAWLGLKA